MRKVRVPNALPFFFTGLKLAASLGVIAAVVAEYFGGLQNGLGSRITSYAGATNYPQAWAYVAAACVLGLVFYCFAARARAPRHAVAPARATPVPDTTHHPTTHGETHMRRTMTQRPSCSLAALADPRGRAAAATTASSSSATTAAAATTARGTTAAPATTAASGGAPTTAASGALKKVKLQLQWFTQAQFAGYFAAVDQGFYKKYGLDVDILEGGVDIVPQTVLAQGNADFAIAWVPKALQSREQGADITDIAQIFQRSGTLQVSFKDKNITDAAALKGKKVGNWGFGNEFELFAGMTKAGLEPGQGRDAWCSRTSTCWRCSTVTSTPPRP